MAEVVDYVRSVGHVVLLDEDERLYHLHRRGNPACSVVPAETLILLANDVRRERGLPPFPKDAAWPVRRNRRDQRGLLTLLLAQR